jgi:hypothetical protein
MLKVLDREELENELCTIINYTQLQKLYLNCIQHQ